MNFFNYESKPMQILMMLGDLIIMNLLFVLCCLPVFTIGAAQAGLYTGLKTLLNPDDDTYCTSAFFKGFKTGFKQITAAWCILFVLEVILGAVAILCIYYTQSYASPPLWAALIALAVIALFQSLIPLFHTYFNCTAAQLIRNAWFLAVAHPLRSLFVAVATWAPAVVLALDFVAFIAATPVLFLIYYSGTFLFGISFMKKPFKTLVDHYNNTHGVTEDSENEDPAQIETADETEVV